MLTSKQKLITELKATSGKIKTEPFDFNKIERFFHLSDKSEFHQVVSERTFEDLDMNEVFIFWIARFPRWDNRFGTNKFAIDLYMWQKGNKILDLLPFCGYFYQHDSN